ncbi:MAG TPA: BrnT family toxin [Candidatus Binataceae bacterium]
MCKTRFTWDTEKNRINVRRHGIAFQDAARIFDGPTVERIDDRFEYGELRIYAIGLVNGMEITVVYTDRENEERHLISAWRSEPHERRYYWKNFED